MCMKSKGCVFPHSKVKGKKMESTVLKGGLFRAEMLLNAHLLANIDSQACETATVGIKSGLFLPVLLVYLCFE